MKTRAHVIIDAGLDAVWSAFDDPGNLRRWQPTLESFDLVSGEAGMPGAVSTLVYDEKGRAIEMTETITERREPDFLAGRYETKHATTTMVNHFEALDDRRTRWVAYASHRFRDAMRFVAPFLKSSIERRVEDDMQRFKLMVETDLEDVAR